MAIQDGASAGQSVGMLTHAYNIIEQMQKAAAAAAAAVVVVMPHADPMTAQTMYTSISSQERRETSHAMMRFTNGCIIVLPLRSAR